MSVRLSTELYKKLAAEGSSTGMMPGESADRWLARIKEEHHGEYNPPADMSLLSDKEILEATSRWISMQSFSDRVAGKISIQRNDSLILIPGGISPYMSRKQQDFRVKFPWLKLVPVMHFIHNLLVLRLVVDLGKKDRKVVLGHHIDPRRNKHWDHWSVGHCQYGFPTVDGYNGDSVYPKYLRIREVMRPILSVNRTDSDEIVWLANSDIGLVALDWQWWSCEEKNSYHWEVGYIPYGPLMTIRGQTRILKDENPYINHNHYEGSVLIMSSEGCYNPITFEEIPPWMNRVYKEFYSTVKTSSNCVPYNSQWDIDVADNQVKNPVVHGIPMANQQADWDELKRRYAEQHKSSMRTGGTDWKTYWALREKERNIYRK